MILNIKNIDRTDYKIFKSQLKIHNLTVTQAIRILINQVNNGSVIVDSTNKQNKLFKSKEF